MRNMFLLLLILAAPAFAANEWNSYKQFRTEGNEDTALDLTTAGDYSNWPDANTIGKAEAPQDLITDFVELKAPTLSIVIYGGDAANDTFSWRLLTKNYDKGPIKVMASGTAKTGSQAVTKSPAGGTAVSNRFWVDTISIQNNHWPGLKAVANDSNSVASLEFPMKGHAQFFLEITDADGSGTEAESVAAFYQIFEGDSAVTQGVNQVVSFGQLSWASGESGALTATVYANMFMGRIQVDGEINTTNGITYTVAITDESGGSLVSISSITDYPAQNYSSLKSTQDYTPWEVAEVLTLTLTPSGDPGASGAAVTVRLIGP